jgi:hypothetical protein
VPAASGLEPAGDDAAVDASSRAPLLSLQQLLQQLPLLLNQSQQEEQQEQQEQHVSIASIIKQLQQLRQMIAIHRRAELQPMYNWNLAAAATAAATAAAQLSPDGMVPSAVAAAPATTGDVAPVECDTSEQHKMQAFSEVTQTVTAGSNPTTDSTHNAPGSEALPFPFSCSSSM